MSSAAPSSTPVLNPPVLHYQAALLPGGIKGQGTRAFVANGGIFTPLDQPYRPNGFGNVFAANVKERGDGIHLVGYQSNSADEVLNTQAGAGGYMRIPLDTPGMPQYGRFQMWATFPARTGMCAAMWLYDATSENEIDFEGGCKDGDAGNTGTARGNYFKANTLLDAAGHATNSCLAAPNGLFGGTHWIEIRRYQDRVDWFIDETPVQSIGSNLPTCGKMNLEIAYWHPHGAGPDTEGWAGALSDFGSLSSQDFIIHELKIFDYWCFGGQPQANWKAPSLTIPVI